MSIKKLLVLLLFLIAIIGIIAPINAAVDVNSFVSSKPTNGQSKLSLSLDSDIGSKTKNPNLTKYVYKKEAELNKVSKIVVLINGYKPITFKKPYRGWEINALNGIEKNFSLYSKAIGKKYSVKFYDKKNKLITSKKGKVMDENIFMFDKFTWEKSLETFIAYFNHDKHYNVFKIKNCASYVVSQMTKVNEGEIAIQLLKTDIMKGNFKKNSIKHRDFFDARYGDLYTSADAVIEVLSMYGKSFDGYSVKPADFTRNFKQNDEAILFVNNNHFILVKKISSNNFSVLDINVDFGKARTFTRNQFNNLLKGENFTANYGYNYSYDVIYNLKNKYKDNKENMIVLTDFKYYKIFNKCIFKY